MGYMAHLIFQLLHFLRRNKLNEIMTGEINQYIYSKLVCVVNYRNKIVFYWYMFIWVYTNFFECAKFQAILLNKHIFIVTTTFNLRKV